MAKARASKSKRSGIANALLFATSAMPNRYEPQSSEFEQDDDGFREGDGALREGTDAGLRSTNPNAAFYLQQNCTRQHVRKTYERVCQLCLATIPAKE